MAPLHVHPDNPRYFRNHRGGRGETVYLTGSHHWDVLLDNSERPGSFDFESYLDRLSAWGHNFFRLWTHEAWTHEVQPTVYLKTDNHFDLSRFNPRYFDRLRARVVRAGERGFYVAVMFFNGWSIHDNGEGNPWFRHPFNRSNNVNGIDGDPDGRGDGLDIHTLRLPAITRLQEAYVQKVIETVGDLDHVLWEISNESPGESRDWQYHLVRHVKSLSPLPVGMTSCFPRGRNEDLFQSPADWISPNYRGGYKRSPPPADGSKVILLDTDHLWGIGGNRSWVWKSFLAGHQPIYMDPLDDHPEREAARCAMGETLRLAKRIDLARMVPSPRLTSSGHCLAGKEEFVAYFPRGRGKIDLSAMDGELALAWLDLDQGRWFEAGWIAGGGKRKVRAPFRGEAVLALTPRPPLPLPQTHPPRERGD
ncbi:MAG TPA: DUF4038 domain-containing protein [Thermoanaerobaculia bacterium]|nr:DUF4038 domain-containing protein [Thermoanaerobaculia bacterium]